MNRYPFEEIGKMREVDPPTTGYYYYPATGQIVKSRKG